MKKIIPTLVLSLLLSCAAKTDTAGGILYQMELDGTGKQKLIDDENIHFYHLQGLSANVFEDERYVGFPLVDHVIVGGTVVESNIMNSYLILDTETNEYKISTYRR